MKKICLAMIFMVSLFTQTMAKTPAGIAYNPSLNNNFFQDIPETDLISLYKLDGNADDSTGNNNGTMHGSTTTINRYGEAGKARLFNGTSDYISTDKAYNNPGPFTVSIWFKTDTRKGGALIGFSSEKTGNGGQRDRFIYMTSAGRLIVGVAPGGKQYMTSPSNSPYNDNKWHLATMTVGANGFVLYMDGEVTNSVASVKSAESYTGYWRIGHDDVDTWPNQPSSFFFQGALDDALIYHRALTADDVKSLYYPVITSTVVNTCSELGKGSVQVAAYGGVPNETGSKYEYRLNEGKYSSTATFSNLEAGNYIISVRDANNRVSQETIQIGVQTLFQVSEDQIVGYYKMNGNANDEMGLNPGNHHGQSILVKDRYDVSNSAYSFNGSNDYISTSNQYNNPQELTISIWFKTNTNAGGKLVGFSNSKTGNSSHYDRHIYMNNAGKIFFGIYNKVSLTVNTAEAYNDNQWHYALATLSSAGMRLYIDGTLKGSNSSNTTAENYSGYWRIGGDNLSGWPDQPSTDYFNGILDDALIYNRALTPEEIDIAYRSLDGAGNNGPVCAGATLTLTAPSLAGASYSWIGPDGSVKSSLQNPTLSLTNAAGGLYTVIVTSTTGCVLAAKTNVTGLNNPGQWTGNVSTDWNNSSNWCDGLIPTSATDVIITTGVVNMPDINSTASAHDINIAPGATLTTQSAGTLNISGMLTNKGSMNNSGTTVFNGTTQQTYSGVSTFNHVTINNTQGFKLPDSLRAANVTIQTGTLLANEHDITISGNWTNNSGPAAFSGGSAKIRMIGTAAQTIGGTSETTFSNLYASNVGSSGITLTKNISIQRNLTVEGVFDLKEFTANRITTGGTLYISATGYLKIGGGNTLPSNYTTKTFQLASTVEYNGLAQTISGQNYGTLILSSNGGSVTKTISSTQFSTQADLIMRKGSGTGVTFSNNANLLIGRNVLLEGGAILNENASTITVNGNWENNGIFNGNTGKVILAGSSATVKGTGNQNFNDLTISGSYVTFSNHSLNVNGNFETIVHGSFEQLPGGTLTMTGDGKAIIGTGILIENLTISGTGKVTIHPSLNISGNLIVTAVVNTLSTVSGSTITMSGTTKTISGAGSLSFVNLNITGSVISSAAFTINGGLNVDGTFSASAQTAIFNGNTTLSGKADLFNVVISGTKILLSSNSDLGIANTLSINGGALLDVTSSVPNTVRFNGKIAQNINSLSYYNLVLSNGYVKTAQGAITVNHDLEIQASTTFKANNYTHTIGHDWTNNGTFTKDLGEIKFVGSATTTISGYTEFNILTLEHDAPSSTVLLLSDVKTSILNMTQGTLETGSNKIEITSNRDGNGFIWGNIQRNHSFTNGKTYAFGGIYNTLSFVNPSGISTVTVHVEKGVPEGFPSDASVNRWYNVTIPNGSFTSATWRLEYDDNFLNGNKENDLEMWTNHSGTWASVGANTDSDIVMNYVEKSGLTNLTGKWTLSSVISEFVWTGNESIEWHNHLNWQTGGIVAERIPDGNDVVRIGGVSFVNQPTISTDAIIKNLVFESVTPVSLNLANGGSLTSGNISANWNKNAIHTININSQELNVNGDMTLGDGVPGQAIHLNIGTGTANVSAWMSLPVDAKIDFTGNGSLKIGGEILLGEGGVFTPGAGTVVYNGTNNQDVVAVDYNHLVIEKASGLAEISKAISVNGNLSINSGTLINKDSLTIKENVSIGTSGIFENKNIVEIGGNWLNNGTYDATGINTIFNGTSTQTISVSTFNNMEFNKPVGSLAVLIGDVTVNGSLVGTSGTLDIKSFHFNRDVLGGSATMTNQATLIIGANNAPTLFGNYFMDSASTIIFDGTASQTLQLPGLEYGNVIFRNTGIKQLTIPITVKGNLSIESGATLKGGSNAVTLLGDWENAGIFDPETGAVIWQGINKDIIGETVFNKVIVSGKYETHSTNTFKTLLELTSTGKVSSITGKNYLLNGDLISNGTIEIEGEVIFSGVKSQTMKFENAVTNIRTITYNGNVSPKLISTSAPQFRIVNINNTGGVRPGLGWTVSEAFNVGTEGVFHAGQYTHLITGNMDNKGTITSEGILNFKSSTDATLNFGTQFSSTGLVKLGGTSKISILGTPASFKNLTIENTNAAGISPASDWTVTNNFDIQPGSIMNAGSYQYFLGGDLENEGIINKETSTFIFNGSTLQEISSPSSFHHVTIDRPSGAATLLTDMHVDGTLHFIKGNIVTGTNSVMLTDNASLTNAFQSSGWVNGNLNKFISIGTTTKIFEVGDDLYFTPVDLGFETITTTGGLTVSTTSLDHPEISKSAIDSEMSVNRFYTIATTGLAVLKYQPRFHFVSTDVDPGVTLTGLHLAVYNGSSWTDEFSSEYVDPLSVTATGVTWFGDMAIGLICNAGTNISYSKTVFCTNEETVPVIVTGTPAGVFSSEPGLVLEAATGVVNPDASIPGEYVVTYFIGKTSGCREFISRVPIAIGVEGLWTGKQSSDWADLKNWSCSIPTSVVNVNIPTGIANYPLIGSLAEVNDLTIEPDASVKVTGILGLFGAITNNGTIDFTDGLLKMNGAVAQEIPGIRFVNNSVANLVINNNSVSLNDSLNITGALTFENQEYKLNTNNQLVLKSNAHETARVGRVTEDNIAGDVTVEHYLSADKAWRLLSIPTNTTQSFKESWQEGAMETGENPHPGYGTQLMSNRSTWKNEGFDVYAGGGPSIKTYNSATNNWDGVSSTNNNIEFNGGYLIIIRGDRTANAFASPITETTLRTKGPLKMGDQPVISLPTFGYTGIGNPYAAPVNFAKVNLSEGVDSMFYAWDPYIRGSYNLGGYQTISAVNDWKPVPGGSHIYSTTVPASTIRSGQAILIHTTPVVSFIPHTPTIQFTEYAKEYPGDYRREAKSLERGQGNKSDKQLLRVTLLAMATSGDIVADGNVAAFSSAYSNAVDGNDALKLLAGGENFGLRRDGKTLSIEARGEINSNDTLHYYMTNVAKKPYRIHFAPVNMERVSVQAYLLDQFLHTEIPVSLSDTTGIVINITSNAASAASDRFKLIFRPMAPLAVNITSVKAGPNKKDIDVSWTVGVEEGIESYEVEKSVDGDNFIKTYSTKAHNRQGSMYNWKDENIASGYNYYRIRIISQKNGEVSYSEIVKVLVNNMSAKISVYPNPVVDGKINVRFDNQPEGKYSLRLFNSIGQLVINKMVENTGSYSNAVIQLSDKHAKGIYRLEIQNPHGDVQTIQVIH